MDVHAILAELVAFDTSTQRSNLPFLDRIANWLDRPGCRIRVSHDDTKRKANFICQIGPPADGGILLSGHSDVVGVDGQCWSSDPFVLREMDGRLYGRGTSDMKGFIACCVAQMLALSPERLRRPLYLALSYDEELGCVGAPGLLADLQAYFPRPAVAIVGEPTQMKVVGTHKGAFVLRATFAGRAAHSSNPAAGLSAIDYAGRFLAFLGDLAAEMRAQRGSAGVEPSYSTLNVGTIQGGTSLNTVAPNCTLAWEFRPVPEADGHALCCRVEQFIEALRREMKAKAPEADAVVERLGTALPLQWRPGNAAALLIEDLTGAVLTPIAVPFGTDAGHFQAADIPAVIMGPGSIEQAHQADEWIAVSQLEAASCFLSRLTARAMER